MGSKVLRPLVAFVCAMAAGTACGQGGGDSAGADPASSARTAPATAGSPSGARPEITAACPLLSPDEVTMTLGSSRGTRLEGTEVEPETGPDGPMYRCNYGQGDRQAVALGVAERPGPPAETLDALAQRSGAAPAQIDGLGDHAVTYQVQGFRYVVTAVPHGSGSRLVLLAAPRIVPPDRLVALAGRVLERV